MNHNKVDSTQQYIFMTPNILPYLSPNHKWNDLISLQESK